MKPPHCAYCGVKMMYGPRYQGKPQQATKDHIVARVQGGHTKVRCCAQCNQDKAHLTITEYRGVLMMRRRHVHLFWFEKRLPVTLFWHAWFNFFRFAQFVT